MGLYIVLATLAVWTFFAVRQLRGRSRRRLYEETQEQYTLNF